MIRFLLLVALVPIVLFSGPGAYAQLAAGADGNSRRLFAVVHDPETRSQSVRVSRDDGRTWTRLGTEASR